MVVLGMSACTPLRPMRAQLAFHLRQTESALGAGPLDAGEAPVHLRYSVAGAGDGGRWTYEIALAPGSFAERRTRGNDVYTFGLEGDRAWLQTGDRPAVVVDGSWAIEARTRAAFFGMRFLHPAAKDHAELISATPARWEMSFMADGARTNDLVMDARTNLPVSLTSVDDLDRVTACEGLSFERAAGRTVPGSMRCSAIAGHLGRVETAITLESEDPGLPGWSHPAAPLELPQLLYPSVTKIDDPMRIHVPVLRAAGGAPLPLLLDSGSPWTIVTEATARALGVVRTDAPLVHVKPPWLPDASYWVGVVDRLRMGGGGSAEIHGASVLVAEEAALGGEAGLIGTDVFRRFVVDVDSPAGVLRFHDPSRFRLRPFDARRADLPIWGTSIGHVCVHGEVWDVAEGMVVLDTGAPLDIVVTATEMSALHPRGRDDSVGLGVESEVTPEYASRIDGLSLGPIDFRAMSVFARDRDKHGNINTSGSVALVGMGLMKHFRLAFDVKNAQLHAWPGPTYYRLLAPRR